VNQVLRVGGGPLTVQVVEMQPCVVGQWEGIGPEAAREAASEAAGELLSRRAERLVLDFARLSQVSEAVVQVLTRLVSEAQRLGREVCLVRCADELFRRMQRAGAGGVVAHAASLLAATQGLIGEPTNMVEMHLRSMPELLCRVRHVASLVAEQAGLPSGSEILLQTAVTEAAANAIVHGSPEGARNHVRVSFHLDQRSLIVDVADQGPGFDPRGVPAPVPAEPREHGYGIHMIRQSMDRVEFFQDEQGMLVRMTKFLNPPAEWARS
jgi:anti-sigma regulatory factor (Ser/Thr protein kinase)/anti-anti-sigma regulatory factor